MAIRNKSKRSALGCLFVALIWSLGGCVGGVPAQTLQPYRHQILGPFDTVTQVVAYCDTAQAFQTLQTRISDRLKELSGLYNIYEDYGGEANLKTVNDQAGIAPVVVREEIFSLLRFAQQAGAATKHQVDVTLGPVLSIWHDYREQGLADPEQARVPDKGLLEQACELVSLDQMILDEQQQTVFLAQQGMSLDVGAIAKGYAAERIISELKADGWDHILLTMGGNVVALGTPMDGARDSWRVGIQNPQEQAGGGELLDTVTIADLACVTSGDYQRYYTVGEQRFHHIIDPNTLFPATAYQSVTIVHPDAGVADLLSTALFLLPYEEGVAMAADYDAGVLWVMQDKTILTNQAYRQFSTKYKA